VPRDAEAINCKREERREGAKDRAKRKSDNRDRRRGHEE